MGHPTQIIVCGLLAMAHAIASILGYMSKDFLLQTEFGIEDIGVPPRACPHFVLSFAMLSLVVEYPLSLGYSTTRLSIANDKTKWGQARGGTPISSIPNSV